ncbi:DUF397 domain-containing protein [Kineosporia babensis]
MSPAGTRWKRSSRCNSSTCVEVLITSQAVHLRDSQRQHDVLSVTRSDWAQFVSAVHLSQAVDSMRIADSAGKVHVGSRTGDGSLVFARGDWDVFLEGVQIGEFGL